MHRKNRWNEALNGHGLLNPQNDIVPGSSIIITKIVIKAEVADLAGPKQLYGFIWPPDLVPALGRNPFIIEIDFHFVALS